MMPLENEEDVTGVAHKNCPLDKRNLIDNDPRIGIADNHLNWDFASDNIN
jgi:hypothetical protein